MTVQRIHRISSGVVQDRRISSGCPVVEGTRVFVDQIIGHLENGMPIEEISQEYDLTHSQVEAIRNLNAEQVQYVKGYADALENSEVHL